MLICEYCSFLSYFVALYALAPVKKKAENGGGKGVKRQLKKKLLAVSDSDSDEVTLSNKQGPVSKTIYIINS